ncbi:hypothetical protein AKJ35_01320 [candidate division MSBL1 archaeon SCGC-AAA833F18]|uniref:HTH cro/C1-type domain-containing protein n=1 Tax=candidate division MSBL1 archaeon SCGC-AAA833F18 TaxID=1698257 RepID=A0A133VRS0_9EURY|nr:hypothetical protein AKJ35_01320 [candidate division MSBL1 archaeon SCGC-AAA833F18]
MSSFTLKESTLKDCPVPPIWTTDPHGKIFVYEGVLGKLRRLLQQVDSGDLSQSETAKIIGVSRRTLRDWKSGRSEPKVFTDDEFRFTKTNLYWLGLFLSDGHLRQNGSQYSYTWQIGSCNPFQGYWYPQFVQKYSSIFQHKPTESKTYMKFSKTSGTWAFYTNVSSVSPIFVKFLEKEGLVSPKENSLTTGFEKSPLLKNVGNDSLKILFQGLMDGDGTYNMINNGIHMSLSFDYTRNHARNIDSMPLVPTLLRNSKKEAFEFKEYEKNDVSEIRFAPSSLSKLREGSIERIVNQFEFMIEAAGYSIRSDKVHALISIVERLASPEYGEYRHCLDIQRRIRDAIRKSNLLKAVEELKKRYPKKDHFFKPFRPKWSDEFGSKRVWLSEAWDFFLLSENLSHEKYDSKENLDFSRGVPIDFAL